MVLAGRRLERARAAVSLAGAALVALGPQATLERGFAIVTRARDGVVVRDPVEAPVGSALRIRVARGAFGATATESRDGGA